MKKISFLIIALLLVYAVSAQNQAARSKIIKDNLDQINLDQLPGTLRFILGKPKANVEVNGEVYGFKIAGNRVKDFVEGGIDKPHYIIRLSEETLDEIIASDDVMNAIEEAYLNGDIVIEPQRVGAKIKFWFLEKIMGWFGIGEEEPCGNGILDYPLGEECDDGNTVDGDGCRSDCSLEQCGDGIVDSPAEECDDGNNVDGDGCNFCVLPVCGDGILDYANGEECDDGNAVDGDGCRSDCSLEQCGDGIVDGGEECDDGNNVDGDGCNFCVLPVCGDGIVDAGEECDDGNIDYGDGCHPDCLLGKCGDGILDYANGEECDDGNAVNGDGCRSDCSLEQCGDGIIDTPAEQCDDGNNVAGDGCDMCVIEQGYADTILEGTITINTNQMNQVIKLVFTEVNNPANTFQTNIVLDGQSQIKDFTEDVGFNINPSSPYEITYEWVSGSKIAIIDSVVEGVDLIDPIDSVALGDGSMGTHAAVNITFSPAGGIISGPVIIG